MNLNSTGFPSISMPSYETPGDGGGGGQADGGTPAQSTQTATPTVYDVSDDTEIRLKGSEKPVKFGEHVKGLQSQFTKASQEAARLRNEVAAFRQREQEAQQRQQQQPQGNPQNDVYAALEALPYMTGKDAATMVRSIADQIQMRDKVLLGALNQMKKMQGIVENLNQTHTNSSFDSKINNWVKEGGYPEEAGELAKEIYLAYEGDDLDEEFPRIFKSRWEQILKLAESQRLNKINAAKRPPFVPGKGGSAHPSKPLEIKANATSKQLADELFGLLGTADVT